MLSHSLIKLPHETDREWGLESAKITSDMRRKEMEDVCSACRVNHYPPDKISPGFYWSK